MINMNEAMRVLRLYSSQWVGPLARHKFNTLEEFIEGASNYFGRDDEHNFEMFKRKVYEWKDDILRVSMKEIIKKS